MEILTNEALREALENLSYRERRVLELRYGLGGEHPRTLDEVGRTFNVTRERIRQIENQSLKKLQNLREAQQLRDDVEIASGLRAAQARAPNLDAHRDESWISGLGATLTRRDRRSADQPDRAVADLDRESLRRSSAGRRTSPPAA